MAELDAVKQLWQGGVPALCVFAVIVLWKQYTKVVEDQRNEYLSLLERHVTILSEIKTKLEDMK